METSVELFNHGIFSEKSDIRAHLSVIGRCVYCFKTAAVLAAIEKHHPIMRPAFQPGVNGKTADGYLLKPKWIEDIRVKCLESWPVWDGWAESLSTSEKGRRAVAVVCELLKRGQFPIWIDNARDDDRKNIQISGTDVVLFARKKIQVKCDYRSGDRNACCSGNLYIQTAERNPLRRI